MRQIARAAVLRAEDDDSHDCLPPQPTCMLPPVTERRLVFATHATSVEGETRRRPEGHA